VLERQAANARPGAWTLPPDTRTVADKTTFTLGGEPIEILFPAVPTRAVTWRCGYRGRRFCS
jgi:hypothetical protein